MNCFLSSGFDEIEVLCSMDTSEKPGNSIEKIEKFIQKKFAHDVDHNPCPSLVPFEFPPGHRTRICNFIKEIRQLKESHMQSDTKSNPKKRKTCLLPNALPSKKQKPCSKGLSDAGHDANGEDSNCLSVVDVSKQIRTSLRKWTNKQNSKLKDLQEGQHYSLHIVAEDNCGNFEVKIRCFHCGAAVALQQIKETFIMSNWYRHAKVCLAKSNIDKDKYHQPAIHSFFAMPKSTTDACNPKEITSVTNTVLDGTANHSIDLTDCQSESSEMTVAVDKNSISSDANTCENKQVF